MSGKHWSDLFLFGAASSLVLAIALTSNGRLLSILALSCCLVAGTLARRRMI